MYVQHNNIHPYVCMYVHGNMHAYVCTDIIASVYVGTCDKCQVCGLACVYRNSPDEPGLISRSGWSQTKPHVTDLRRKQEITREHHVCSYD